MQKTFLIIFILFLVISLNSCQNARQKLIEAVKEGDLQTIEKNINNFKYSKTSSLKNHKDYLLYEAVKNDNIKVVKYLIEEQNLNLKESKSLNNIFCCTDLIKKFGILKYLINKGVNINLQYGTFDKTLLHDAIFWKQFEAMKILILNGAKVNRKTSSGTTPFHLAVERCDMDFITYLVSHGADVNSKGCINNTPLHIAAKTNKLAIVKYLIDELNADYMVENELMATPFHYAVEGGALDVVKYFVEQKKIDYNKRYSPMPLYSQTPIHIIESSGKVEIIKYFDLLGVDFYQEIDTVYNSTIRGNIIIHEAVRSGRLNIVKFLIEEKKIDVNYQNTNGWTPLHFAVYEKRPEIIKYLISKKADLQKKAYFPNKKSGLTPIDFVRDKYYSWLKTPDDKKNIKEIEKIMKKYLSNK